MKYEYHDQLEVHRYWCLCRDPQCVLEIEINDEGEGAIWVQIYNHPNISFLKRLKMAWNILKNKKVIYSSVFIDKKDRQNLVEVLKKV